jgi:hypothetical protein
MYRMHTGENPMLVVAALCNMFWQTNASYKNIQNTREVSVKINPILTSLPGINVDCCKWRIKLPEPL